MNNLENKEMSLFDWCIHNGERGRQLRFEYKYKDENGDPVEIRNIPFDSEQVITWECINGHTWKDSIINRVNGADCPECEKKYEKDLASGPSITYEQMFGRTYGTSYAEQFLFYSLKQIYPNAQNRLKVFRDQYRCGLEFDIVIPSEDKKYKAVFIEYSSTYFHKDRFENDEKKERACNNNNVRFIQIIDDAENIRSEVWYDNLIVLHMNYNHQKPILVKILSHILKTLNHSISEINLEKALKDAWTYSHGLIPYSNSIVYRYPELAKEWNYKVNKYEKPDKYSFGSGKIIPSWKCPHCGFEFRAKIGSRVHGHSGCRRCGFSWYKVFNGETQEYKDAYIKEIRHREKLRLEVEEFNRTHGVNNNQAVNEA